MQHDFTNAPEVVEATQLVERAEQAVITFKITTPAQYEDSASVLKRIKAGQKRLEELRVAITGPLNAALKAANDLFRAPAERLAKVERSIKSEISRYQDEQERIRQEEQRKADELARKAREKAEADAAAARAKAEQEAEELRRKAETERAAGNAAAAARLESRAESKIDKAEDRAQDLELQAATTVAPIIQREAPKVTGIATREVWKFEITDPSKINPQFLMPDEKKIGAQVRALKGDAAALIGPGVRVYSERQIAAGAA